MESEARRTNSRRARIVAIKSGHEDVIDTSTSGSSAEEYSVELRLDSRGLEASAVRRQLARFLRADGSPDSDFAAAEVIIGELVANVVRHAPGPVRFWIGWGGGEAKLVVQDSGPGFDLPRAPAEAHQEGGRGLALVQAFAREVLVRHEPGVGTTIEVTLPVRRSKLLE